MGEEIEVRGRGGKLLNVGFEFLEELVVGWKKNKGDMGMN